MTVWFGKSWGRSVGPRVIVKIKRAPRPTKAEKGALP